MSKSLSAIVSKLKSDYGKSLPDVNIAGLCKRIVLSSPQLNYIFGGGFPLGKIVELNGSPSTGKSVISNYIGGEIQKRKDGGPKAVIYVDMEYSFDKKYANNVGLNTDENFYFIQPLNGEEAFTIMDELVKTGEIGLIIYDSVTATPTASQMTDEYGKATFGGGGKVFSEGLKKINPYISRFGTSLILLRQMRAKVGFQSYGPPDQAAGGGYAPEFYASWRARVSKGEDILDKKEVIGNMIKVKNIKSKIGYPKRSAQLDLYYSNGFNPDAEYIDFIIKLGIVQQKGAWITNEAWDLKVQGKDKLLGWLHEHPDIFNTVKTEVNATFSTHSMLDDSESEDDDIVESEVGVVESAPS